MRRRSPKRITNLVLRLERHKFAPELIVVSVTATYILKFPFLYDGRDQELMFIY